MMSESSESQAVLYEKRGALVWLTLNRPEVLNAHDVEVRRLLPMYARQADDDPDVRVILVRGAGDRAFCAGGDIREFLPHDSLVHARQDRQHKPPHRFLQDAAKPTIAVIHGFCLGGGLEIATSCDIRIASEDALFGHPEVSLGTLPGAGGTQRLSRVVGLAHALHIILTAERINAEDAYRMGLVSKVVPREQLLPEAERLANVIASRAPLAVALAKESVRRGYELELEQGLKMEADLSMLLHTTEDRNEAAAAFREKRKTVFKGR